MGFSQAPEIEIAPAASTAALTSGSCFEPGCAEFDLKKS
jgi:hypothetical protein